MICTVTPHERERLRRAITRTVAGYDAADPARASTFALRDEWMGDGQERHQQGRVAGGYGALIEFLAAECRRRGAAIHLGAAVAAIDDTNGVIRARCRRGALYDADAAILTVPLLHRVERWQGDLYAPERGRRR